VIVTLAAWLYIIQALLGLGSLFSGPFGLGGGTSTVATLLVSGLFGAMGVGLLRRESWGRWLALGVSLMSWTLGSMMLIGIVAAVFASKAGAIFFGAFTEGGWMAIIAAFVLIFFLIMIVSVVISFKLFFYLCSEDGCEEFGVPYGSAGTVVASIGAWIAIFVGQVVMSSGGSAGLGMLLAQQAMARDRHSEPEVARAREQMEAQRREYLREREEQQRRAEQEARLRAIREEQEEQPVAEAAAVEVAPASTSAPADSAPAAGDAVVEDEKPDATRILKCRDPAGAVTFTQGYCPPGTKRVDMTRPE